ncbi:MAG: hypothetical protein IJU84_10325 [Clostridia bacterium]|nr:hypothetical protein [Clostridia bacterium]MBQ9482538.1 hypothetical protein [Clostridia bacterium]
MKIKSKISVVLGAFLILLSASCGAGKASETSSITSENEEKYRTVQFLQDGRFAKGFNLRGLNSVEDNEVCKVITYGKSSYPVWQLAQWWSNYNLKDGTESFENGVYSIKDTSKEVSVDTDKGTVTLALDGSEEFESCNLTPPSMWPHLLIEQTAEGEYWLKDADEVNVSLRFTVNKSVNLRGGNEGCHAQFAWFIYVVDRNPDSMGYGNFLWFGLNLFDSTKIYTQNTAQQDTAGGPGNFIYSLGSQTLFENRVRVGESAALSINLKDHVAAALETAQANGFMEGTTADDCLISGMNLGWEVFDRFDVSVTIEEIGIEFRKKI